MAVTRKNNRQLHLWGAREHNLQDVEITIPHGELVVLTGPSGSGKSSLAFDCIHREGQRRYLETLSAYARQYIGLMEKPDVDGIEGLPPTIAIEQRGGYRSPRSTVGTLSEVYDFLRLLYARLGQPHCPECGLAITRQTPETVARWALERFPGKRLTVLAPLVRGRKGEYRELFASLRREGYLRFRVDGSVVRWEEVPELARYEKHDIAVVLDRIAVAPAELSRLTEAVEKASGLAAGHVAIGDEEGGETAFNTALACPSCGKSLEALEPAQFSFNNPAAWCPECEGMGRKLEFLEEAIIPDPSQSVEEGAIALIRENGRLLFSRWGLQELRLLARHAGVDLSRPWKSYPEKAKKLLLWGSEKELPVEPVHHGSRSTTRIKEERRLRGLLEVVGRIYRRLRVPFLEKYARWHTCPACAGGRLRPEMLAVTYQERKISDLAGMTVRDLSAFFAVVKHGDHEWRVAREIVEGLRGRLGFLEEVGLHYLAIDRPSPTLAGGELQRLRLAAQLGTNLGGVLYVLDEPTIGLHPVDQSRLLGTLRRLQDQGNTLLVVEHDEDTMRAADRLLDLGPGSGRDGGRLVAEGTPREVSRLDASLTGLYLSGKKKIEGSRGRPLDGPRLVLQGAQGRNLKIERLELPLGVLGVVTGVSGSGKSSLLIDTLVPALGEDFDQAPATVGGARESLPGKIVGGTPGLKRVVEVDQDPPGRSSRSNPATFSGLWNGIRDLLALSRESQVRGFTRSHFSFNVAGGRCETCRGLGYELMEMPLLGDVSVTCRACAGRRFREDVLEVRLKGKNVAEILALTVDEAEEFFESSAALRAPLALLREIGLGYLALGQPSRTLSGGEAQRLKLAAEIGKSGRVPTFYVLDEPTTGLHFNEVTKLLGALQRLVDAGHTVYIIEHHPEVIQAADFVLDLGPGGGGEGGRVVFSGPPERLLASDTLTGQALSGRGPVAKPARKVRKYLPADEGWIEVEGASQHNLKNVSVKIPRGQITVVTGVSGSGKTSLVFDTLHAEAQQHYLESLSTYARRFLTRFTRPQVKEIRGLCPTIAVDQRPPPRQPRSTVGTRSEIQDYLRLLFTHLAEPWCPVCRVKMEAWETATLGKKLWEEEAGKSLGFLAPLPPPKNREEFEKLWKTMSGRGFSRLEGGGKLARLDEPLPEWKKGDPVALYLDRFSLTEGNRPRLFEAIALGYAEGGGRLLVDTPAGRRTLSDKPSCPKCGLAWTWKPTPRHFSFNSHLGACPTCRGLGSFDRMDEKRLIRHPQLPLLQGALDERLTSLFGREGNIFSELLARLSSERGVDLSLPYKELSREARQLILFGDEDSRYELVRTHGAEGKEKEIRFSAEWKGLISILEGSYQSSEREDWKALLRSFMTNETCGDCGGQRLSPEALSYRVREKNIAEWGRMEVGELSRFLGGIGWDEREKKISRDLLREIKGRLGFLEEVGLGYLALDRKAHTLSGGEAQRLKLACQLGSPLTGVIYILDEPTVGLHTRDNERLLATLRKLRDRGNTVIAVEHDAEIIAGADYLVEVGPGPGAAGGEIVAAGPALEVLGRKQGLTSLYLSGERGREKRTRRTPVAWLSVEDLTLRNLDRLSVKIPRRVLVAVSGVSGAGKSTLALDGLVLLGEQYLYPTARRTQGKIPGTISGMNGIRALKVVDGGAIGTSDWTTPATYTGIWDLVRDLFAATRLASERGWKKWRFSFHSREARCAVCEGKGSVKVSMHFLSDVDLPCEACAGRRFNEETLSVKFKGKSVAEVLAMDAGAAAEFFDFHAPLAAKCRLLTEVGLGYLALGQPSSTLSSGENQRLRLARELGEPVAGRTSETLYVLDEPTVGLHAADVERLMSALHRLVDRGHSVVVIEHNLDVLRGADYLVDLGPEAGAGGGRVVATGTPEEVARAKGSITGKYLK